MPTDPTAPAADETVPVSEAARDEAFAFVFNVLQANWNKTAIEWLVQAFARFEATIRAEYATPAAPANGGVPDGWSFDPAAAPEGVDLLVYRHDGGPLAWGYGVRAIASKEDGEWFDETGDPMNPPVAWTKLTDRPLPPGAPEYLITPPLPEQPTAAHRTEREALHLEGHGEWAALGDRQEDAWLLRFCDTDMREAIWTGRGAEREAWAAWNRYAPAWNCYVFRLARLTLPDRVAQSEMRECRQ